MFSIEIQSTFSAAHALWLGPRATAPLEPLHGHDFHVTVRIDCAELDGLETVFDFHQAQQLLEAIVGPWRNRNLNEIPPFSDQFNPSAERIAQQIGVQMRAALAPCLAQDPQSKKRNVRLREVSITEAPGCRASWSPEPL